MSRILHIETMAHIVIGANLQRSNHCRTDEFLKPGSDPMAVQKAGKALIIGLGYMSVKLCTRGSSAGKLSLSLLYATLRQTKSPAMHI